MEQVNEPKERNWLQKTFNFGGPGWFHDVIELQIVLDTDDVVRIPDDPYLMPYSEIGECATYKVEDTITGVVTLTAPPECRVWVTDVVVTFEQFAQFNRSVEGYQLAFRECVVPGTENGLLVEGTVEVPFAMDLNDVYPNGFLRPTYTGTLYYMRHHLAAVAHRPWFGHECETRVPVHLQRAEAPPAKSIGKANAHAAGLPPHVLPLPDLPGECVFDYKRNCVDVAGTLAGLVSFRKLTCGIAFCKVELIKVEWSQQESMDTAVWTNVLYPPKARLSESGWLKNKVVRLESELEDEPGEEVVELVEPDADGGPTFTEDANFPVELDLKALKEDRGTGRVLTPSYARLDMGNIDPDDESESESDDDDAAAVTAGVAGVELAAKTSSPPPPPPKGPYKQFKVEEDKVEYMEGVAETAYFVRVTAVTATGQKSWNTNKIYLYQGAFECQPRTIDIEI